MSSPALRRTCRRLTAVVLLQLGVISGQLFDLGSNDGGGSFATFLTLPIVAGAGLYLVGSVGRSVLGVEEREATTDEREV